MLKKKPLDYSRTNLIEQKIHWRYMMSNLTLLLPVSCVLCVGDFRNLVDVNFCCAMGPPGGGRNPITARLQRHFNLLAFTEMEDPSKKKIFGTILKSWMRKYCVNN
jgi:hypothetical protein